MICITYYIDYSDNNGYQYHWFCVSNCFSQFMGAVLPSECEWIVPGTLGYDND